MPFQPALQVVGDRVQVGEILGGSNKQFNLHPNPIIGMKQNHSIPASRSVVPIFKELSLQELLPYEPGQDETDKVVKRRKDSSSQGRSNSHGTQERQKPQVKLTIDVDSWTWGINIPTKTSQYQLGIAKPIQAVPQDKNDSNAQDTSKDDAKNSFTKRKKGIRKVKKSKGARHLQTVRAKIKTPKKKNPAHECWKRSVVLFRRTMKRKIEETTVLIGQLQPEDPRIGMLKQHIMCWQYALNSLPHKRLEQPFKEYLRSWSAPKKGHQDFYIKFQELCSEVGIEESGDNEVTKIARGQLKAFLRELKPQ